MAGKLVLLKVDKKGRVLLSRDMRQQYTIKERVVAELSGDRITLKPLEDIGDPVEFLKSLKVKTRQTPVQMKREAEGVFG